MKKIPLGHGEYATVDDQDYNILSKYKWHCDDLKRKGYAKRGTYKKGKVIGTKMHRQILGLSEGDGKIVDHINRNKLDNRRCNLRICSTSENLMNTSARPNGTSKYKGVHWQKRDKVCIATITCQKKQRRVGGFPNELDAAIAYDKAAKELHGEFAYLNFPDKNKTSSYKKGSIAVAAIDKREVICVIIGHENEYYLEVINQSMQTKVIHESKIKRIIHDNMFYLFM